MKKYLSTIIFLLGSLILIATLYLYTTSQSRKYPKSTGGDRVEVVPPNVNAEPDAMEKLAKLLPLETSNFSITFDFKKGKYIVTKTKSSNLQVDFDKWYKASDYKAISKKRFLLLP